MAMRRCGEAGLVPASEEKKKRGEEGWIAATCAAAESRTGAGAGGASAPEEGLAAMRGGWAGGRGADRRDGALGFCRGVYSGDELLVIFRGFSGGRLIRDGGRGERGFWFELEGTNWPSRERSECDCECAL